MTLNNEALNRHLHGDGEAVTDPKNTGRTVEEELCLRRAMSQWRTSLKRPDLDEESRVMGALQAYERQAFALSSLSRRSTDGEAVAVKPLVWLDRRGDGSRCAIDPYGGWFVATANGWGNRDFPEQNKVKGGLLAAMAAAEASHQAAVRSALYAHPGPIEPVAVKPLEWHDDTEGPGCPIRFATWPLHGYRIHLYQWGEADRWAVRFGVADGTFLPKRGDAEAAKAMVQAEWSSYLQRAALTAALGAP